MNDYTPITDAVRTVYAIGHGRHTDEQEDARDENFGRWLAAHDADVARKALLGWADYQEQTLVNFAYVVDDEGLVRGRAPHAEHGVSS
jgi:hypothetical protein